MKSKCKIPRAAKNRDGKKPANSRYMFLTNKKMLQDEAKRVSDIDNDKQKKKEAAEKRKATQAINNAIRERHRTQPFTLQLGLLRERSNIVNAINNRKSNDHSDSSRDFSNENA